MNNVATLLEALWVIAVLLPGAALLLVAWSFSRDRRAPEGSSAPRPERSGPRPVWARGRGESVRGAVQVIDGLCVPEAHRAAPEGLVGADGVRSGDADARSPEEDIEYARRRAG